MFDAAHRLLRARPRFLSSLNFFARPQDAPPRDTEGTRAFRGRFHFHGAGVNENATGASGFPAETKAGPVHHSARDYTGPVKSKR